MGIPIKEMDDLKRGRESDPLENLANFLVSNVHEKHSVLKLKSILFLFHGSIRGDPYRILQKFWLREN